MSIEHGVGYHHTSLVLIKCSLLLGGEKGSLLVKHKGTHVLGGYVPRHQQAVAQTVCYKRKLTSDKRRAGSCRSTLRPAGKGGGHACWGLAGARRGSLGRASSSNLPPSRDLSLQPRKVHRTQLRPSHTRGSQRGRNRSGTRGQLRSQSPQPTRDLQVALFPELHTPSPCVAPALPQDVSGDKLSSQAPSLASRSHRDRSCRCFSPGPKQWRQRGGTGGRTAGTEESKLWPGPSSVLHLVKQDREELGPPLTGRSLLQV